MKGTVTVDGTTPKNEGIKMAADPVTRQWWTLTDPCQEPFDTREEGAWWAGMDEVFHHP